MRFPARVLCLALTALLAACASDSHHVELHNKFRKGTSYSYAKNDEIYDSSDMFFSVLDTETNFSPIQAALINTGKNYLGTPYVYGSNTPDKGGFDCSGFTQYVYMQALGQKLPRTAAQMATLGTEVDEDDLKAGDLVFFDTQGMPFSHVGIYLGEGRFFHASTSKNRVMISNIYNDYFMQRYNGARRITSPYSFSSL